MPKKRPRTRPGVGVCKGCGRCIEACAHHCIAVGAEIHPVTGLVPVVFNLERCTACGLCFDACPEPHGLLPVAPEAPGESALALERRPPPVPAADVPDERLALLPARPLVMKGTYASAIGALLAGCRHFFGYPITPSTEGAELMARLLPPLGGSFVQAVSEVAAIDYMYGCGAAGCVP
jgi:NAD-dependent dihydropyrimidine dehydrogenase PreA subunit